MAPKIPKSILCSIDANFKLMIINHAEENNMPWNRTMYDTGGNIKNFFRGSKFNLTGTL
jgi:hypothetical protein